MSIETLARLLVEHGYLIVFVAIALECAALPIPGELLLLTFGGLAVQGRLDPVLGVLIAALGVMTGDSVAYWAGRVGGSRAPARLVNRHRWTPGHTSIVLGRFVVGARVLVAPMAGARRVSFVRFLALDGLGALIWSALFVVLGYVAGAHLAALQRWVPAAMLTAAALLGLVAVVYATARARRFAST